MTPAATIRRWFTKLIFRIRMMRFPRAPQHPRSADGRYIKRTDWRLEQMRRHSNPLEGALAAPTGPAGEAHASSAFSEAAHRC